MNKYCAICAKPLGYLNSRYIKNANGKKIILCNPCLDKYGEEVEKYPDIDSWKEGQKRQEEEQKQLIEERKRLREKREKQRKKQIESQKRSEKYQELKRWKKMSLSQLIQNLGSPNENDRIKSAKYLGKLEDRKAVRPLLEALKDRENKVILHVIDALGKIGDPRALDELRKVYAKYHKEAEKYQKKLDKLKVDSSQYKYVSPEIRKPIYLGYRRYNNFEKRVLRVIDELKKRKFELMAQIAENKLKDMNWQDFEDTVIDALNAFSSEKRTSDMGIDGITKNDVPIQIKQSERIGRNIVDNFETALRRYYPANKKNKKGIIVAFSFTKGAYTEADRARKEDNIDIQLITVDELI